MKILFEKNYSSESIVDVFRDISEAFERDYNPAANFDEHLDYEFNVIFNYENEDKLDNLLNKNYSLESIVDIEEDVTFALKNHPFEADQYGFFEGDLILRITF